MNRVREIQRTSGGGDAGGQSQLMETNSVPTPTEADIDKLKYRLEILKKV